MAIAVLISSVALLIAAIASLGTYRAVRRLETEVTPLVPKIAEFLANSRVALDEAMRQFRDTGDKTQALIDEVRAEVKQFGVTRAEVTARLHTQLTHIEDAMEGSLANIEDIVTTVHGSVIRPVREVNGWIAAIRGTLSSLFRR